MVKDVAISLYVFFYTLFCGCGADWRASGFEKLKPSYKIRKTGKLPPQIPESSGLALASDNQTLWILNDGGNSNHLFRINVKGEILEQVQITGARNIDWEDLTKDDKGNLYIGDFGNNANNRKNLTIYKVREADMALLGEIKFHYPDQTSFPPPQNEMNFDCEAMIWQNDSLWLFSKDWSGNRISKQYKLPDQAGTYAAELIDSLKIKTWITGAASVTNNSVSALLGYGKIYLFRGMPFINSRFCIPFRRSSQAEAIVFFNNSDFIITNEQGKLFIGTPKK